MWAPQGIVETNHENRPCFAEDEASARIKNLGFNTLASENSDGYEVCSVRQGAALWKRDQSREQYAPPPLESQFASHACGAGWCEEARACVHRMRPCGSCEESRLSHALGFSLHSCRSALWRVLALQTRGRDVAVGRDHTLDPRGLPSSAANLPRCVGRGEWTRDSPRRRGQILSYARKPGRAGAFARRGLVAQAQRARRADQ